MEYNTISFILNPKNFSYTVVRKNCPKKVKNFAENMFLCLLDDIFV